MEMEEVIFKCNRCGECCRKISDEDVSNSGLPLFEWEVEKIKNLAENKKIKTAIRPIDCLFDKKSGKYFCTGYVLTEEPCVFLKNNICSIHKDRPIFCRAFPVAKNPLFLDNAPNLNCFSKCPNFDFEAFLHNSLGLEDGKSFNLSREELSEKYTKTFDKEIMKNSFKRDEILDFFNKTMDILSRENLIDIELIDDIPENIEIIPFLQFLVHEKFISEEERQRLIND